MYAPPGPAPTPGPLVPLDNAPPGAGAGVRRRCRQSGKRVLLIDKLGISDKDEIMDRLLLHLHPAGAAAIRSQMANPTPGKPPVLKAEHFRIFWLTSSIRRMHFLLNKYTSRPAPSVKGILHSFVPPVRVAWGHKVMSNMYMRSNKKFCDSEDKFNKFNKRARNWLNNRRRRRLPLKRRGNQLLLIRGSSKQIEGL